MGASSEPYASVVPVLKVSALASALQTLSVSGGPTGGSFTLSFGGQTSTAIGFNTTASQVQTALQATPTIGGGDVTYAGGPLPGTAVQIFFAGRLAFHAQPLITIGTNGLTGGATPAPSVVQTTAGALVSDVQTISVSGAPTAGSFQLAFGGRPRRRFLSTRPRRRSKRRWLASPMSAPAASSARVALCRAPTSPSPSLAHSPSAPSR